MEFSAQAAGGGESGETQGDYKTLGSPGVLIVDPTHGPVATGAEGNHTWIPGLGAFMLVEQANLRMDPLIPTERVGPERRARHRQLTYGAGGLKQKVTTARVFKDEWVRV